MSFTALTVTQLKGPGISSVAALGLAIAPVAMDAANGNSFPMTGKEIILFQNTDVSAHTITLTSVPDGLGRSGDIATYNIPAGGFAAFDAQQVVGWIQTDGTMHISTSSALVFVAVLRHA